MTLSSVASADHRPWPLPGGRAIMAQTWHDLLFAHWPVRVDEVRHAVPAALETETFDGSAWLGVIPFRMTGVRLRGLPALPGLSAFPELNVRTYVTYRGQPGVWFFSLDAGNALAVAVARRWYHLPYFHARMSCRNEGGWVRYASRRVSDAGIRADQVRIEAGFIGRYRPTGEVFKAKRGSLEYFLTERYCLYATDSRSRLYRAEIHHQPWPLQPAEAETEVNTMAQASGLRLPDTPPLAHFARRLEVVVWPIEEVTGGL